MTNDKGEGSKRDGMSEPDEEAESIDPNELIRRALRQCNINAAKHERSARTFLKAGLGVSVGAIVLYVFFLTRISYVSTEFVAPGVHKEPSLLPGTPPDPKLEGPAPPDGSFLRSEEENHIKHIEEFGKGLNRMVAAMEREQQFSWKKDGVPLIRNTLAFFFIEVIAGYLLAIYQRNELQASFWRAHRQVYERLLIAPDLIEKLVKAGVEVDSAVIQHLTTPTMLTVYKGSKEANPYLGLISNVTELSKRPSKD